MRFVLAAAAALLIAGCQAPPQNQSAKSVDVQQPSGNFDYRYAFRVPGERIAAVQESHAKGCEQLGPSRCRITALKYGVSDGNQASAVLALMLDPVIARAFGKAAEHTVVSAKGALVSVEVLNDRSVDSIPARLQRAVTDADAKLSSATDAATRATLTEQAAQARAAMATITSLDRANGPVLATSPVLINYAAGNGSGVGGATFQGANDTLMVSLAGLATILAGIGPWLLILLGGALVLRLIINRTAPPAAPEPAPVEERGIIGRLLHRDDDTPAPPEVRHEES